MPDPGLEIRGGGGTVIQTLTYKGRGGRYPKKDISALRASVWSKNKGAHLDPPPHTLGKQNKQAKEVY